MIDRYDEPEMKKIWERKYKYWFKVESELLYSWKKHGLFDVFDLPALDKIEKLLVGDEYHISVKEIEHIERKKKHDVAAFVEWMSMHLGGSCMRRWLHFGATSSDIVDTSLSMMLQDACEQIEIMLLLLLSLLKKKAYEYKDVETIGRTHGVHAERMSLGLVFAYWYAELKRHLNRIEECCYRNGVGNLSGPVGNNRSIPVEVEEYALDTLGLRRDPSTTQIISRDRFAEFIQVLSLLAASIEKFCVNIRHRSMTELGEFSEHFSKGQVGSSAMPHKKNPVNCETITGITRQIRSCLTPMLESVPLWFERDVSNSSVERFCMRNATSLTFHVLRRFISVIRQLNIDKCAVRKNRYLENVESHYYVLQLIEQGFSREHAYKIVKNSLEENEWSLLCGVIDRLRDDYGYERGDKRLNEFVKLKEKYKPEVDNIFEMIFQEEQ